MKVFYSALLLSFVFGFVTRCSAQGATIKGQIAHTGGTPLQVVVENDSTGALLLVPVDANGYFKTDILLPPGITPFSSFIYNCNGQKIDTGFYMSDSNKIITWNTDYCPNYVVTNSIVEGQIYEVHNFQLSIAIKGNNDTVLIAQGLTDTSGKYSILIPPPYSVSDIKCSFTNCNTVTVDTVLLVNHNVVTWNAHYCITSPKTSTTFSGHLSNTNGAAILIHIQVKDSFKVEDNLEAQTDSGGYYSIKVPSSFLNDSVKYAFINCNNQTIDTIFVLQDTLATWNEIFCPNTCAISFTSSYCPCTNTFYIELDTTHITFSHWSVQWSFGEGSTSNDLFPSKSFSNRSLYTVCVSLFDSLAFSPVCTFCHAIGFDSTDHLVTRLDEDGGFNLQVIAAGTLQQHLNTPLNSFGLYPNPVSGKAGVMMYSDEQKDYNVTITNSIGQQVFSGIQNVPQGSSNFTVDVHQLPQGMYFMTINFQEKRMTKMFLKN